MYLWLCVCSSYNMQYNAYWHIVGSDDDVHDMLCFTLCVLIEDFEFLSLRFYCFYFFELCRFVFFYLIYFTASFFSAIVLYHTEQIIFLWFLFFFFCSRSLPQIYCYHDGFIIRSFSIFYTNALPHNRALFFFLGNSQIEWLTIYMLWIHMGWIVQIVLLLECWNFNFECNFVLYISCVVTIFFFAFFGFLFGFSTMERSNKKLQQQLCFTWVPVCMNVSFGVMLSWLCFILCEYETFLFYFSILFSLALNCAVNDVGWLSSVNSISQNSNVS